MLVTTYQLSALTHFKSLRFPKTFFNLHLVPGPRSDLLSTTYFFVVYPLVFSPIDSRSPTEDDNPLACQGFPRLSREPADPLPFLVATCAKGVLRIRMTVLQSIPFPPSPLVASFFISMSSLTRAELPLPPFHLDVLTWIASHPSTAQ